MDILLIIGTIMAFQLTFAVTGFAATRNPEDHGIINLPMTYAHPEFGRKASKFLGTSQLIMLIITIMLFFVLRCSITSIVVSAVVGFVIPFIVSILLLYRMVKLEDGKSGRLNDEQFLKEQIKKEELPFYNK